MKLKSLVGRDIDLKQDRVDDLKMRLRGPVLIPGDVGYDESRTVWNAMIDKTPAMVARCLGVADVITCVQFAREHELLLCIKGGGHNIAGLATADGAMMLDMSLMRGVWVDKKEKGRPCTGWLPARRCGLRNSDTRTRCRSRLHLTYRHRRTHPGRRFRLFDEALGLDGRHRDRYGRRNRRCTGHARE